MRKLLLLTCILLVTASVAFSQKRAKQKNKPVSFNRHYNEILPVDPQYKMNGWVLAPGATYMMTRFISRNETLAETDSSRYDGKFTPLGKPGIYLELGRYKFFKYPRLFRYMDYGIAYKSFRGKEKAEGSLMSLPGEAEIQNYTAEGSFGYHYVTAHLNLNHVWRLGKYNFLQNTLGFNVDYAFITNYDQTSIPSAVLNDPGKFLGNIHYKLGYGIKMRGNWLLIPSIETPIMNLLPFEPPRSSLGFFTSRYRPIIFSLRFLFMRPSDGMDCTPVRTREGMKMPTDMDKQREMNKGG